MPTALTTANAVTAALSRHFPDWRCGATIVRDSEGNVCGALVFSRVGESGAVVEFRPWLGGPPLCVEEEGEVDYSLQGGAADETGRL